MNARSASIAALLVCGVMGCAGQPTAKTVRDGLDAMSKQDRLDLLEAMSGALDRRPEYVDELYAVARRHPATFRRFLMNTVRDLRDRGLAEQTLVLLVEHPDSFEQVMLTTLDVAEHDPNARATLTRSIVQRRTIMADILTDRPGALAAILNTTLQQIEAKPDARAALRKSLRQSSAKVAPILIEDPDTVGELMRAMIDAGLDRSVLKETVDRPAPSHAK